MNLLDIFKTKEQKRLDKAFRENRLKEIYQWCDWITAARNADLNNINELELKCHSCKDTFIESTQNILGNNKEYLCKGCPFCGNNISLKGRFIQKVYKTLKEDE